MSTEKRKHLGRGLSALMGEGVEELSTATEFLPLSSLIPNPYQPRLHFDDAALSELVESIKSKGILQPLIVRKNKDNPNKFEIIAGERRWRAAQKAGLEQAPVLIKNFTDEEALEVALIENLQRENLNPLEEAKGYKRLMDEFKHTQDQLSHILGKSRSHVSNMVRILTLPDEIKEKIDHGKISAGHAKVLLQSKHPITLAEKIIKDHLNVRQAEEIIKEKEPKKPGAILHVELKPEKDPDIMALEEHLTSLFKIKTVVKVKKAGGEIVIPFDKPSQLDSFLHLIDSKFIQKPVLKEKEEEKFSSEKKEENKNEPSLNVSAPDMEQTTESKKDEKTEEPGTIIWE